MIETIKNAFANKDIRKKILLTLLLLVVFRIGCYIPVPGLARGLLTDAVTTNDFLGLMSGVTGGALANGTLFALGIGPYINASIIVQLLTVGIPALERLSKQGEEGRKKLTNITRIITIVLAVIQAVGIIVNFAGGFSADVTDNSSIRWDLFFNQQWLAIVYMVVIYTAGAMLVMWLGERITEYGVGNGISLIIFVGIISTAGLSILDKLTSITANDVSPLFEVIGFLVLAVVVFFCIVFVDLAERKIPVQYAKQVRGTKMYGGQSSVIPMKISGSGVMPLIFAFAIISFPSMIMSVVPAWSDALNWWNQVFGSGTWLYVIVLAVLIFAFAFFYAQIQFNPEDVSRSIQQNGGFIQGIRPGKPTAQYLRKINNRITLFGAIFLTIVAFVPSLIFSFVTVDLINVFSTTGILIVVSVALELDKQLQSQIMMKNYKGFLK
ncbi:MAG: preprotein translocase subunit SecY [Bacillota bacterium]|uniref:Protein translocase subunit SecY n=1 Tax=Candidatus Gallimonas intestinavium TaxID=2838603 RepID=A0A9D2G4A0_9FIRM|nr:MAG: preprotein translocase subunit SecY [Bacillota bacterium]HIZ72913.1 preprotein translocase subunit SecY [Candidatus Gallimonas intestinavium]